MTNLDYYLTEDHAARQRTTVICLIVGGVLAILLSGFGLPSADTAIACVVAACAVEVTRALLYTQPSVKAQRFMPDLSYRRAIMRGAFSTAIILMAVVLRRIFYAPTTVEAALDSAEYEAKAGNIEDANKRIQQVSTALEQLKTKHEPARPEFFRLAVDRIDQLQPAGVPAENIQAALVQLAEYRSSLQPASVTGVTVDCNSVPGVSGYANYSGELKTVEGAGVLNCHQPLDGIAWVDTVFVNSHIEYSGGPVILKHVTFIHCTFRTTQDQAGVGVLRYVALGEKEFRYKA